MRKIVCAIAVAGAVATGCGGDDGPTVTQASESEQTTTSTTAAPEVAAEDTVAYFEAFAGNEVNRMQAMLEHADPGSPAAIYAQHQIDSSTIYGPSGDEEVVVEDDTITLVGTDEQGDPVETVFGDFEASADGKLITFSVNGEAITRRIVGPGGTGSEANVTVALRSAYQTVTSEALSVMLDVTNGSSTPFEDAAYNAVFVAADGRQYAPDTEAPPVTIQPGATALVTLNFPQAPLRGRIVYSGFLNNFNTEVTVEVPIR